MLRIIETRDYNDMSRKAANIISAQIILKNDSVIGLATGSTPLGIYATLIHWCKKGDLDFSKVKTVNLDEYCGLPKEHAQSYYYFMQENLFKHINIDPGNTYIPNGMNLNRKEECEKYHKMIEQTGGIDLQLLGIGNNGHIGFNEPDDQFANYTHCVELTQSTIEANSRFFDSKEMVPKQAYTMGIGEIMSAKQILIVASGKGKAKVIKEMIEGPVSPKLPASILKFHHNVTLIADQEALSLLDQEYLK